MVTFFSCKPESKSFDPTQILCYQPLCSSTELHWLEGIYQRLRNCFLKQQAIFVSLEMMADTDLCN